MPYPHMSYQMNSSPMNMNRISNYNTMSPSTISYHHNNQSFNSSGYGSANISFNSPSIQSSYIPNSPCWTTQNYTNALVTNNNQINSLNTSYENVQTTTNKKRKRCDEQVEQEQVSPITTKQQQQQPQQQDIDDAALQMWNDMCGLDESDFMDNDCSVSNEPNQKKKRVLNPSQRIAANKRERKRMTIMNDAFVDLRHKLPISTGRKRRKMSRLDIVIGAMEYIHYLDSLLNNDIKCFSNNNFFGFFDNYFDNNN